MKIMMVREVEHVERVRVAGVLVPIRWDLVWQPVNNALRLDHKVKGRDVIRHKGEFV